jgi:hypothetical protein
VLAIDLLKPLHKLGEWDAHCRTDVMELDQIKPSLPVFVLGHKTLRLPKPLGKLNLREPSRFADMAQKIL